ncbi:MAG: 4Fe-4S cluster-binding domain-containing protein, partial [Rhodopirellula sp. JB053]
MDDRIPSLAHHDCNSGASLNDCCPRDPSIGCERDRDSNAEPQSRVAERRHDVVSPQPRENTSADVQPEPVRGFIHSVETCGTVDGPGLRYVMFLSGCPLRCQYCHNPDANVLYDHRLSTVDGAISVNSHTRRNFEGPISPTASTMQYKGQTREFLVQKAQEAIDAIC